MPVRSFFAVLSLAVGGQAQDWSAWAHQRDLYFDTSPSGVQTSADVAGFPVLVRLTPDVLPFAQARDSGQDLRFSGEDGKPLPYEIERWDRAAGKAEVWVRAPRIPANSKGRLFRMHWGNPAAPDADSANAVFAAADGFVNVWHLRGRYPTPRPNAVAGGSNSIPIQYDNDEEAEGVIAWADSLDGAGAGSGDGDHLQVWEQAVDYSAGFTFSVWAYPTAAAPGARFLDFGNGAGLHNFYLGRLDAGNDLVFGVHNGASRTLSAPGAIALRQWQHFAVTVKGDKAHLYRNGALLDSLAMGVTLANVQRAYCYLGRSNWPEHKPFQGKLDEPVIARAARSAEWIRLAYSNQKPGGGLLSFTPPAASCASRFAMPAGLEAAEGSRATLAARADCASRIAWSHVSGPAPGIPDPAAAEVSFTVPRITGDTLMVLKFTAEYGDSARSGTVAVRLREAIPDPAFIVPDEVRWNGRDSLQLKPAITNLAALKAAGRPELAWAWSTRGVPVDTAWREGGILLKRAAQSGVLVVGLCLDNGGERLCRESLVVVDAAGNGTAAVRRPAATRPERWRRMAGGWRDLLGRLAP